jgi:hypothetical protein
MTCKQMDGNYSGARHFIDRNAPRLGHCQTPDYGLKTTKVPGT